MAPKVLLIFMIWCNGVKSMINDSTCMTQYMAALIFLCLFVTF